MSEGPSRTSPLGADAEPAHPELAERQPLVGQDLRTEELVFNMGPQHPATHGVLRVVVKSDGEVVRGLEPHVGNLHRCSEKAGMAACCIFVPDRVK